MTSSPPVVAACVKWVDLRPDIDALAGSVSTEVRRHGFSAADRAAFEVALRLAEAWGAACWLVTVAPPEAERDLIELAASGATRVVRVDGAADTSSKRTAASLAAVVAEAAAVVCGDLSADVGSGSVPATVAHHLGAAQALGLLSVEPVERIESDGADGARSLRAVRRLDGGRREHLAVPLPAVLSVEGSVAVLRRAPVARLVAAGLAVEVVAPVTVPVAHVALHRTTAWRPRARTVAPPAPGTPFERIVELTGALVERTPPRRVELAPEAAAEVIVEQLQAWGYLD